MRNIEENLVFAFGYNTVGIPIAAGLLYPFFETTLSPMITTAAMAQLPVSNRQRQPPAHLRKREL